MAYVLGYFCADGCMFVNPRGSRYVAFYSTDKDAIINIKKALLANHKLTIRERRNPNWKRLFCFQVGSKVMYSDLQKLGLASRKARRMSLPSVPNKYLRHFIRGYFDGDGCISYGKYKRKDRCGAAHILMTRFTCASRRFLDSLSKKMSLALDLKGRCITKDANSFQLVYSKKDTLKLFNFMYNNVSSQEYIDRKYKKFQEGLRVVGAVA